MGSVGLLVCYDMRFPEPARVLALLGAQVIVQPTNLPRGGEGPRGLHLANEGV